MRKRYVIAIYWKNVGTIQVKQFYTKSLASAVEATLGINVPKDIEKYDKDVEKWVNTKFKDDRVIGFEVLD